MQSSQKSDTSSLQGNPCGKYYNSLIHKLSSTLGQLKQNWSDRTKRNLSMQIGCDYLPSEDGRIPCLYKPVTCCMPPNVTNSVVVGSNRTYAAKTQVEYSCASDKFQMEGDSTITCLYSGQ